jgi:hypothetical protein
MKKYYETNKEKIKEQSKKYREVSKEKFKEKRREYMKKYNKTNKEKRREYARKYYEANKEKINKQSKKYRETKKEERAKLRKEGKRRAKIRATWARKYVKNYDAHVKAYTDAKAYDKATIELNAYYEENRKRYLEVIGARLKLGLGTIKKPYPEK